MAECPVCGADITLEADAEEGEIIACDDCGSELEVTGKGYTSKGYDQGQRAYLLEQDSPEASSLSFKLLGSDDTPIHNPCIVVKNWTGESAQR